MTTSGKDMFCPNCGSTEIECHEASGASICTSCGVVVEENNIVSSVGFVEGAGGAISTVGQFVGANSSKAYNSSGGGGNRYGFSRDSRETTLANGRRRIQDVASRLRLGGHFVDTAHRFFTVAVEKNFVQGRRSMHVVAACLYIACRQEKSQHMLIDFSDALQVNVYTLGTCFLKFRRLLGLKLEIIDPALYVYRFAAHLDLDDKANAVALTALRLVGRMKRDWIVAGRRPAGICAAALLIAARAHGFTRQNQDVTKVLRVCGMTVSNRVKDFESTPSANLTLEQFNTVDLESEADPPIFTSNRIREARAAAIQEKNVELLTSGKLDDPRGNSKRASRWREIQKMSEKEKELNDLYNELETEMNGEATEKNVTKGNNKSDSVEKVPSESLSKKNEELPESKTKQNMQQLLLKDDTLPSHIKFPLGNNGKALVLPNQATAEELQKNTQPEEDKLNLEAWREEMPEHCIGEIDDLFRDDEEVKQKEAIFNKMNKDYIEKQERKENERLAAESLKKEKEDEFATQEEERARYLNRSRHNKRRRQDSQENDVDGDFVDGCPTTEEALLAAISSRKTSRKINYDALSILFDDSGSFATDLVEDNEPEKFEDPMLSML